MQAVVRVCADAISSGAAPDRVALGVARLDVVAPRPTGQPVLARPSVDVVWPAGAGHAVVSGASGECVGEPAAGDRVVAGTAFHDAAGARGRLQDIVAPASFGEHAVADEGAGLS